MMREYKLIDCVELLDSQRVPLSKNERKNKKKIFPYYGAQGIIDYVDDYIFSGEYILIAEDGNNLKTQEKDIATWATGKFWVNNHAHILGEKKGFNLKYIYYYLNSINIKGLITGSAQPKLNQENLSNIVLKLPDIKTQENIVDFLDTINEKISINEKIKEKLFDLSFQIFSFDILQNSKSSDYTTYRFGELFSFVKGKIPKSTGVIKNEINNAIYVNMDLLNNIKMVYCSTKNGVTLDGETIMVMDGASSGDIFIGKSGILGSTLAKIIPKKDFVFNELAYLILYALNGQYKKANTGSAIPHANPTFINSIEVKLPNDKKILQLKDKISDNFKKISEIEIENLELINLKTNIISLLLNGKVIING